MHATTDISQAQSGAPQSRQISLDKFAVMCGRGVSAPQLIYSTYLAINKNERSCAIIPALRFLNRIPAPSSTLYVASLSGSVGICSAMPAGGDSAERKREQQCFRVERVWG